MPHSDDYRSKIIEIIDRVDFDKVSEKKINEIISFMTLFVLTLPNKKRSEDASTKEKNKS